VLRLERNTGFAGGNNAGWEFAQRMWPDLEFLTLLNPDTRVGEGWLSALAGALDAQPRAAAAQPLLLLHDRPDRLNTLGNRSHFLGFGHVSHLGEASDPLPAPVPAMQFPSGAAVMLRAAAVRGLGLFDERFFLYLEDADLGWKLRQAGHELILAPAARVWHKYRGDAPLRAYELLERNRWILLLTYYRWRTLLLLAPALAAMELGQCLFSLLRGVPAQKLRAWGWHLSAESLGHVLRRRREAQRNRRLSDRAFLADFTGRIDFPGLRSPLLRWVANPLFAAYWAVARRLILW
jgi:GT2 family glycosyltransferase